MLPEVVQVLSIVGIRPVIVPDLGRDALLLLEYGLMLIDGDLSVEKVDNVIDWGLAEAAETLRVSP